MGFSRKSRMSMLMVLAFNCAIAVMAATEGITDGLFPSLFGGGVNVVFSPIVDVDTSVNSPSSETTPPPPSSGLHVALPSVVRVKTSIDSPTTVIHETEEPPATRSQEQAKPRGVTVVVPSLLQVKTTVTTTPPSNSFSPASVHASTSIDIVGLGALGSSVVGAASKPLVRLIAPITSTASISKPEQTSSPDAEPFTAPPDTRPPDSAQRSLRGQHMRNTPA